MKKTTVSAVGCSLADYLYTNLDFGSAAFNKYKTRRDGDGGLSPGHLVFTGNLEKFSGVPYSQIIAELGCHEPDGFNIGGPAIVATINASQLVNGDKADFKFFGVLGKDQTAERIYSILRQTPVNIDNYQQIDGMSPFSDCLSDPGFNNGNGERLFVNNLGVAGEYSPEMLGEKFFEGDILFFGATALVPRLHDNLGAMLKKGRDQGKINFVTTVFDFRNEMNNPGGRWPLGDGDESFAMIDALVMDWDETMKISGCKDIENAFKFFIDRGIGSLVVTHGADNIYAWSGGSLFKKMDFTVLPVCSLVEVDLKASPETRGDTTGCGDNFAGGILASLTENLASCPRGEIDLLDACSWGAASGGFAGFCVGGTYIEKYPGEKREKVSRYYQAYRRQIGLAGK